MNTNIETDRRGLSLLTDLTQYTTLTPKQIRNRAKELHPQFPDLIMCGGRGHNGKYWVHFSAIPMLTERKYRKTDNMYVLRQRLLSEKLFYEFSWDYFGCVRPAYHIDENMLVESIRGFTAFWAIHRLNDTNHIHFALCTNKNMASIQLHLTAFFRKHNIRADNRHIEPFSDALTNTCFNYFVGRAQHSQRSDVLDWG